MGSDSLAFGTMKFVGKWTPKMKGAFNIIADHWGRRVAYPSHESYTTKFPRELSKKNQTITFKGFGKYTYLNNLDMIDTWIRASNEFEGNVGQAYEDLALEMQKNGSYISVSFVDAETGCRILYKAEGRIRSVIDGDSGNLLPILKFEIEKEKNYEYNSKNLNHLGFYSLAREYDYETSREPIVSVAFAD